MDVPHRQVGLTIPETPRIYFNFRRKLLGELCRAADGSIKVDFEALTGEDRVPGIIAAVQTFGDRINFHPHLHLLMTEGGVDWAGTFHRIPRLDDGRLADVFAREVLRLLVNRELLSSEWAERILSWRHSGFNVHSRVRARTTIEAERVGKYMVRPVLSLERLCLDEREGRVGYRWGRQAVELETMDYLEFIARVTSHIPDRGQVMVRYYGLYANAHRGKVRKASRVPAALGMMEDESRRLPSQGWSEMIRKVYEVDPLICPRCGGRMKVVAFLTEYAVVDRIIRHLELTFVAEKPPPAQISEQTALMAAAAQHSRRRVIGSMSAAEESEEYD